MLKSSLFYLRALFALIAVGVSGVAAAAGIYSAGSALGFTPFALSNNGVVLGVSSSSAPGTPSGCSYYACTTPPTTTQKIYMTGSQGAGLTSLGSATGTGSYTAGLNDFSILASSSQNGDWNNFSGSSTSKPTPVTLSIAPSSAAITLHSGGTFVPALVTNSSSPFGGSGTTPYFGVNDNGNVAANLTMPGNEDGPFSGAGAVLNLNSKTVTFVDGAITGLNSTGAVAYTGNPVTICNLSGNCTTSIGTLNLLANGTVVQLSTLGYGGQTGGVNTLGQVTGRLNLANGNTVAFETGDNGSSTKTFGTANGVSSTGTVVNSSGQIGGYVTLASGQTEAFLSTARGGLMVGIGAGASTDSTSVAYLNDSGQAIIWDRSTGMDYLYSGGVLVPLSSLISGFSPVRGLQQVVGFNNAGQILLNDPGIYSPASSSDLSASYLSTLAGATSITGTSSYQQFVSSQGNVAPSSTFFTSPTTSVGTPGTASSGVPGPAVLSLLALAALGLVSLRKRKTAELSFT